MCLLLFVFPPDRYGFYPQCPVQQYLHFACPGCGATRAFAALLHGRLTEALRQNALFVLLLPLGVFYAGVGYRRALQPGAMRWPAVPAPVCCVLLASAAAFTLLRAAYP